MGSTNPIIYVRGFAGGTGGINKAVDDPLYGFNEGSTHVRIGDADTPRFFQFEGPVLRLITDDQYEVPVHGSQHAYLDAQGNDSVSPRTIWIHRFYDSSASTFGKDPQPFSIEASARDLFAFLQLVLKKTAAERVHLVAHSMGGLICRSMIQKVIPEIVGKPNGAADYIDRFFTYATPHGGINLAVGFGLLEKVRDLFDIDGAAIFGPDRMHEYLTPIPPGTTGVGDPPPDWQAAAMPTDCFPPERVFSLVGTNPDDYEAALGLSAKAVGVQSDGLVQIRNAFVPGAPRAYVHRSHSGRYGIVNSEEGYQNLRRFLFGDLQARLELQNLEFSSSLDDDIIWQLEMRLAIRGLQTLVNEQTTAHHCPIEIERRVTNASGSVSLLTTFLDSSLAPKAATDDDRTIVRYALSLRLISLRRHKSGILDFKGHLEQTADFDDSLIIDYQPGSSQQPPRVWGAWNSTIPGAIGDWQPLDQDPIEDAEPDANIWRGLIPLPKTATPILGEHAQIVMTVTPRN